MASTVNVILSTYEPSPEYLRTQIKSILTQSYPVEKIIIRDDGSPTQMVEPVPFCGDARIDYFKGANIGFAASFLEALSCSPRADYYAFCDQDDQWEPDKIEHAVEALDKLKAAASNIPVLYCSNYLLCDENLNPFPSQRTLRILPTFENSMTEAAFPGVVMIFNHSMRLFLEMANPDELVGHDWLAYMIAAGFGEVIIDERSLVRYRRHAGNVSNGSYGFLGLLKYRVKEFLFGDYLKKLQWTYLEYQNAYGKMLEPEQKKLLELLIDNKSIPKRIKKFLWPHRYRSKVVDDFSVRALFLFGKL